jgi:hypothetical protein
MIMLWLICLALAMIYFRAFALFCKSFLLMSFINENGVFPFKKKKNGLDDILFELV